MDSLRYGLPPYNGQITCDFAIEIIHFQPLRFRQSPISRQQTENVPPKDKLLYKIYSLQERMEIEASGRYREISIKISTDSNLAMP